MNILLRNEFMDFFKNVVNNWDTTMIDNYLSINSLPKPNCERKEIIQRIIRHEENHIYNVSDEDVINLYNFWKEIS